MAVVNTSVFSEQTKRTILPWTIVQLVEESHTFDDFFMEVIKPRMNCSDCQLLSASIGPDKLSLDPVDIGLQVLPVLHSFGRFLKYYVEIQEDPIISNDTVSVGSIDGVCRLAFFAPVTVRNKKDQLYNDLIDLFVSHNALLRENEVVPFGKELVTCLRDVLWYVDGYQAVFAERAIPVTNPFSDSLITICRKCQNIASEERLTYLPINSMALFKIFAPYFSVLTGTDNNGES